MAIEKTLPTIGKTRKINVIGHAQGVPAKIDTGADSSAIWASNIFVDEAGILHFTLFDKGSEFYNGEIISRKAFKVAQVRSSSGHTQVRYRVELPIRLGGKRIRALFNLSDRSNNEYPILIGRRTITGKFLVDVSRGLKQTKVMTISRSLTKEMERDPYAFFQKYHQKTGK